MIHDVTAVYLYDAVEKGSSLMIEYAGIIRKDRCLRPVKSCGLSDGVFEFAGKLK